MWWVSWMLGPAPMVMKATVSAPYWRVWVIMSRAIFFSVSPGRAISNAAVMALAVAGLILLGCLVSSGLFIDRSLSRLGWASVKDASGSCMRRGSRRGPGMWWVSTATRALAWP